MRSSNITPGIMSKDETLDAYYTWLCRLVNASRPGKLYGRLLGELYNKNFHWTVPNDHNRSFEGIELRERFCVEEEVTYVHEYFDFDCNMLELIIALAYRCEDMTTDVRGGKPMCDWFWNILENAGLEGFTDDQFDAFLVDEILNKVIERRYDRFGRGGLFPLKNAKKDQRKVELWYQMNEYLVENYFI